MIDTESANPGRRGEPPAPCLCALPQLINPNSYTPCDWDLLVDDAGRKHWLDQFHAHFAAIKSSALVSGYREADIDSAWREIDEIAAHYAAMKRNEDNNILVLGADDAPMSVLGKVVKTISDTGQKQICLSKELRPSELEQKEIEGPAEPNLENLRDSVKQWLMRGTITYPQRRGAGSGQTPQPREDQPKQ